MPQAVQSTGRLDRLAIGLSGLCLAHCIASVFLLSLLASAGGLLLHPAIHQIGLGLAILIGSIAMWRGSRAHRSRVPGLIGGLGILVMVAALFVPHGPIETICTMVGVAILALGHDLNRRAAARPFALF